jgi:hypothetical protein
LNREENTLFISGYEPTNSHEAIPLASHSMSPGLRKIGLIVHITSSVSWFGAVAAFLLLNVTGLTSQDAETVRGAYLAMNLIGRFVILPLSLTALASGFVQALGTEWGLFRHFWVLVKLLLTILSTIVLIAKIPLMGRAAHLATETALATADLRKAGMQLLVHSSGGMVVLLGITAVSVFKPWSKILNARRHQREQPDPDRQPAGAILPLGLKIFFVIIGIFVAGLIVLHIAGGDMIHHAPLTPSFSHPQPLMLGHLYRDFLIQFATLARILDQCFRDL